VYCLYTIVIANAEQTGISKLSFIGKISIIVAEADPNIICEFFIVKNLENKKPAPTQNYRLGIESAPAIKSSCPFLFSFLKL